MIKWKKISDHCISYDVFYVSKYILNGSEIYGLWKKDKLIKYYKNAKDAKNDAMVSYRTESSIFDGKD